MKKVILLIIVSGFLVLLGISGIFIDSKNKNVDLDDKKADEQVSGEEQQIPNIYDNYSEEEMIFLNELMGLTYYNEDKIDRYLRYINSEEYNYEEIIRVVNTNNDLEYFEDAVSSNMEDDILILVNKYNHLDSDYEPSDLKTISSSYSYWGSLREEANDAFLNMVKDAAKEGLKIINTSPYRSYKLQNELYTGYVKKDGKAAADRYSARPGYSEHQTGLAIDVVTPTTSLHTFENTKEFIWMKDNSYKYGFILRYGEGMEYITGYKYEPWHYRYVGVNAAKIIYDENLTFEEYYYYYVKKES